MLAVLADDTTSSAVVAVLTRRAFNLRRWLGTLSAASIVESATVTIAF